MITPTDRQKNQQLADIFLQMAKGYRYLGTQERFRAIAYQQAAKTLLNLPDDITKHASDIASLDKLRNIGEGIAQRILEYLHTGHIHTWDELRQTIPLKLLDIMDVQGMGPATTRTLHQRLGIQDRTELETAIRSCALAQLKGFGPKRIDNIRKALKIDKEARSRHLLDKALDIGNRLLQLVRNIPAIQQAEIAGSLRRRKETIGDIDIIATCHPAKHRSAIQHFTRLPIVDQLIAGGDTKASILLETPHIQADLRIVDPSAFGSALLYLTGSREHNIRLRSLARDNHRKINEYGLYSDDGSQRLAGETETSVYHALSLDYIEPELREDKGEIDLAKQHRLPRLIHADDLLGDMQMHSNWSDGATDIASIALHARLTRPHYQYIVITDHSPAARIAHGIDSADFRRQWKEIDKVNTDIGKTFVRKGVEVDILPDGSLDLPDDILQAFDWVTASIHSGFAKDNTDRLLKACHHPLVNCIGHPSGRLLMKREPYPADWTAFFHTAAQTGTALEINAQPDRLDLRDDLARQAVAAGVRLTISTDAHHPTQLSSIHLGVSQARRAGCTSAHILNTLPWDGIRRFRDAKASHHAMPLG